MKDFRIQPIRNGTVIDHITPGKAVAVLEILGLPAPGSASVISVAINVSSAKQELKDVVKIEDRELEASELARIREIAPQATISIVRNFEVAEKKSLAEG